MLLPNAAEAIIAAEKVLYLLDAAHPQNGGKARSFQRLGYALDSPEKLAHDLRAQQLAYEALEVDQTIFGRVFTIRGILQGPAGDANILSVWIIRHGESFPRLITAYPWR